MNSEKTKGIWIINSNNQIIFADQGISDIIGLTRGEMLGKSWFEFIPREETVTWLKNSTDHKSFNTEISFNYGHQIRVRVETNKIAEQDQSPYSFLLIVTDIEKEEQWEEKRKKYEAYKEMEKVKDKLQTIWDVIGDSIYIIDSDFNILEANKAAGRIQGAEQQDIIGQKCYTFYQERQSPCPEGCPLMETLRTGNPTSSECTIIRKSDGTKRWMLKHILPLFNSDGHLNRAIIYARDITEIKQAEKKLHESERLYRLILDTNIDGISFIDHHGIIRYANRAFCVMAGDSREEVIGKDIRTCLSSEEENNWLSNFTNLFQNPSPGITELTRTRKDGKVLNLEVAWNYVYKREKPTDVVLVCRDITEKKKLQQKLIHSEKLSAVGQLAAGISHEFNNILTVILGSVQMELMTYRGLKNSFPILDNLLNTLEVIENQSLRGRKLVQNINMFARTSEPVKELCQISQIIEEVIELQNRSLALENIKVIKNYEHVPDLNIDRGQFQQVFLNMIINARHALQLKGKGEIWISIWESNNWLGVDIKDNGIGMDEKTKKNLFTPFYTIAVQKSFFLWNNSCCKSY